MSCILVAISAMRPRTAPSSTLFSTACAVRDLGLIGLYITVLVLWKSDACNEGAVQWVFADMIASALRLLRQVNNWAIDKIHDRRARRNSPAPRPLSPGFQYWSTCSAVGICAWIDWLAFLLWIFGTWLIRPTSECKQSSVLVRIVSAQLLADTIFYCTCTGIFGLILIINRCCPGKLSGIDVDTSNWPVGCPRLTVNTSMWRRRGETTEAWRARVDGHDVMAVQLQLQLQQLRQQQPRAMAGMTTELRMEALRGMSRDEIEMLRTFTVPPNGAEHGEDSDGGVRASLEGRSRRTSGRVSPELPTAEGGTRMPTISLTTVRTPTTYPATATTHDPQPRSPSSPLPSSSPPPLDTTIDLSAALATTAPTTPPAPPPAPPIHAQSTSSQLDMSTSSTCALCLSDYAPGERVRELPCLHQYHASCIDPWLANGRRTCPICSRVVRIGGGRVEFD
ncbi:E3 ubiquitin-protein ligase rnf13 [Geranomyces michiganensis]|nr:E3 ubiquitin-protein ligase rnf13 [Geranomyces michiganensis]